MSDINDIASKCDLFIDNAATASQTDFDDVTREAIRLNVFAPMLSALIAATPRPEASDAPDIVPVAWMRVLPGHVVGHIETQEDIALHQLVHGNFAPGTELKPLYSHDALAALRAELAAVKRERDDAIAIGHASLDDVRTYRTRAEAADAEVARLKDENKELVAGLEPFAKAADQVDAENTRLGFIDGPEGYGAILFRVDVPYNALARARSLTATKGG